MSEAYPNLYTSVHRESGASECPAVFPPSTTCIESSLGGTAWLGGESLGSDLVNCQSQSVASSVEHKR